MGNNSDLPPATPQQLWERIQRMGVTASISNAASKSLDSTTDEDTQVGNTRFTVDFDPQQSSDIAAAQYDANRLQLILTFRKQDRVYCYNGVPLNVWNAFLEAPSPGKFFYASIRTMYPFERLR